MGVLRTLAIFLCCLAVTVAAHAEDPCASGQLEDAAVKKGMLYLKWIGTVRYEMHKRIAEKFDEVKDKTVAVVLVLSSCGGNADAEEKTIHVLKRIKKTHILFTMVGRGSLCASACVGIFLQGKHRDAALTSSWGFHEPSLQSSVRGDGGDTIKRVIVPVQTEAMLKAYAEAGVSKRWLKRLRAKIRGAEWWQTGRDLWEAKSGIITDVIGNSVPRAKEQEQHFAPVVTCGAFCRG
jgi:hypothetical protein